MLQQNILSRKIKVATVFGTRPEAIKLAPVIEEIHRRSDIFDLCNIVTSQHTDLLDPLLSLFKIRSDYRLQVLKEGQSLDQLLAKLVLSIEPVLSSEKPDIVLIQGDTTSALAGALSAFQSKIPTVHVEAGLRSSNRYSPFPEEMNRRLITQLAAYHMAATERNLNTLIGEGVASDRVFLTGNPVVDALHWILNATKPSASVKKLLTANKDKKILTVTSHRRENFESMMAENLAVIRDFVLENEDTVLIFPVHPNPEVKRVCNSIFQPHGRIQLIEPLIYPDFVHILKNSWLIASDSGGIQEEAPSVGKPLLVLRENTERPEVLECGSGQLIGKHSEKLNRLLQEYYKSECSLAQSETVKNPFGNGDAAIRIVNSIQSEFDFSSEELVAI